MDSKKSFVLNPVIMSAPWNMNQSKSYENPAKIVSEMKNDSQSTRPTVAVDKRGQNVQALMERFLGLKKYQARAALTMSGNDLEKAIILLEVSLSYRKVLPQSNCEGSRIKNIIIQMQYDTRPYHTAIRNVILKNYFPLPEKDAIMRNEEHFSRSAPPDGLRRIRRIGVIIEKTKDGYRAIPFDEVDVRLDDK